MSASDVTADALNLNIGIKRRVCRMLRPRIATRRESARFGRRIKPSMKETSVMGVGGNIRSSSSVVPLFKGASINDIRNIFRFFDPLSPCPHLELICSIKFTQPPLRIRFSVNPLRCGHHTWMLPNVAQFMSRASDRSPQETTREGPLIHSVSQSAVAASLGITTQFHNYVVIPFRLSD